MNLSPNLMEICTSQLRYLSNSIVKPKHHEESQKKFSNDLAMFEFLCKSLSFSYEIFQLCEKISGVLNTHTQKDSRGNALNISPFFGFIIIGNVTSCKRINFFPDNIDLACEGTRTA